MERRTAVETTSKVLKYDRDRVLASGAHSNKKGSIRPKHPQKDNAHTEKYQTFQILPWSALRKSTGRADEAREEEW